MKAFSHNIITGRAVSSVQRSREIDERNVRRQSRRQKILESQAGRWKLERGKFLSVTEAVRKRLRGSRCQKNNERSTSPKAPYEETRDLVPKGWGNGPKTLALESPSKLAEMHNLRPRGSSDSAELGWVQELSFTRHQGGPGGGCVWSKLGGLLAWRHAILGSPVAQW